MVLLIPITDGHESREDWNESTQERLDDVGELASFRLVLNLHLGYCVPDLNGSDRPMVALLYDHGCFLPKMLCYFL